MKKAAKWLGIVVGALLLVGVSGYAWASWETSSLLEREIEVHDVDFAIPFPLTEDEIEALRRQRTPAPPSATAEVGDEGDTAADPPDAPAAPPVDPLAGVDLDAIALERAIARGQHLVQARYACVECHGDDFGGGMMVDDPMMGRLLGPNITAGEGGRTREYAAGDWDRIVRHGVTPKGRPTAMPAEDFEQMTDQELSDMVAYIRSLPVVNRAVERVSFGPLGTVLIATGKLPLSADVIHDHMSEHARRAPHAEPTAEFGAHLATVCTGCHRESLEGGPIAAGPPDWPPARNITPHADGLADWAYEDFLVAMREAKRPDGSAVAFPMSGMTRYAEQMTDVELQALWAYLQSVDARPTGQ